MTKLNNSLLIMKTSGNKLSIGENKLKRQIWNKFFPKLMNLLRKIRLLLC